VIFVFVAERRKLFVDLALVLGGLASRFDPSLDLYGNLYCAGFSEFWP